MAFRLANVSNRAALVAGSSYYDLEELSGGALGSDPMSAIAAHAELHDLAVSLGTATPSGDLAGARLGPPVPAPRHCFAIGLNYRSHVAESAMEIPTVPVVFTKFPGCLCGPNDAIELRSAAADWEAELVVVIGDGGRDIAGSDAWNHVAGLTAGQDISDRVLQFSATPAHFDLGKSRDTYGPTGPVVASPDCFPDLDAIPLRCEVNGEVRQAATTADLIFSVPALVAYLSQVITLQPGDLVFTGTPEGVGATTGTFLRDGDVVTTTIDGIGTMENHCVAAR